MSLIADALLLSAAIAAALYCRILALRLKRLGDTDKGLGGAISTLSVQVDEMKAALNRVSITASQKALEMERLVARGDIAARRLELLLTSLHETDEPVSEPRITSEDILKLAPNDKIVQEQNGLAASRQISRLVARKPKAPFPGQTR
ncbi:MAG: hypothetical protein KDA67_12735 [Rhodobacteraceae bacterium]|nr:hypothetical protein [Paracoccaceae bacterium]